MKHITIIPSKERASYFLKYNDLPLMRFSNKVFNTHLWVSKKEEEKYKKVLEYLDLKDVKIITGYENNISEVRENILNFCKENNYEYLFSPDDDVRFFSRELNFKLLPLDLNFSINLFNHLSKICSEKYPLVSTRNRFMINNCSVAYEKNYKIHLNYFIHIPTFIKEGITYMYEDMKIYEDRIIQIQLLEKGYTTITTSIYGMDQRHGNNSIGGCSSYRSIKEANRCAELLHSKYPEFTQIFIKNNWNTGKRKTLKFFFKRFIPKGELNYVPIKEMESFCKRKESYFIKEN